MSFDSPEEGERLGVVPLRDVLIQAALSPDVAIPTGIRRLDLGVFGTEAEELLERTLKDLRARERERLVYVTHDRRILIQTRDTVAPLDNPSNLDFTVNVSRFLDHRERRGERQDSFLAAIIHSHRLYGMPLSGRDLSYLFRTEYDPLVAPCVFAIISELKMLAFRTKDTPQWDNDTVEQKLAHWRALGDKRVAGFLNPRMPEQERMATIAKANHALVRSIGRKYHLLFYSCPSWENVAILETA